MLQVNSNDANDSNKTCKEERRNSGPLPKPRDAADKENHDSVHYWNSEREALLSVIKEEREQHSSLLYKVGAARQAPH